MLSSSIRTIRNRSRLLGRGGNCFGGGGVCLLTGEVPAIGGEGSGPVGRGVSAPGDACCCGWG